MASLWGSPQPQATVSKTAVLNSWKEIAAYLGRAVRTVQRYERDFDLPVRRVGGKSGNAVIALPADLDAWLRRSSTNGIPVVTVVRSAMTSADRDALTQHQVLRLQCESLRQQNHEQLTALVKNITAMVRAARTVKITGGESTPDCAAMEPRIVLAAASNSEISPSPTND